MPSNKEGYMKNYYSEKKDQWKKYLQKTVYCHLCQKDVKALRFKRHERCQKHVLKLQAQQIEKLQNTNRVVA